METDRYLLHLSRYIHLNLVKAKLAAKAQDWDFSSYQEYLGVRKGTLPQPEAVLSHFSSPDDYRLFVESYQDNHLINHLTLD